MTDTITCPVCKRSDNITLDTREHVPTLQNVTLADLSQARKFPSGSLKMVRCQFCGFVWNQDFDPTAISYDDGYDNNVSASEYYKEHLYSMADRIIASVPPEEPIHYVEIGCGQADFLNLVVERSGGQVVSAIGFDPAFTSYDSLFENSVVHKSIFDQSCQNLIPEQANVICSRHTIEHVKDVDAFINSITAPMDIKGRKLFIETPDANWILRSVATHDFFYEHCSLYTPESIKFLLAQQHLESQVSLVYGEQYMWVEASRQFTTGLHKISTPLVDQHLAEHYVKSRSDHLKTWVEFISEAAKNGPVAIWGAASKGVTFISLFLDEPTVTIDCAIDLNTGKQNRFLPTTGTPVVAPEQAVRRGVKTIIIMNPNYEMEIREMVAGLDWNPNFSVLNDGN